MNTEERTVEIKFDDIDIFYSGTEILYRTSGGNEQTGRVKRFTLEIRPNATIFFKYVLTDGTDVPVDDVIRPLDENAPKLKLSECMTRKGDYSKGAKTKFRVNDIIRKKDPSLHDPKMIVDRVDSNYYYCSVIGEFRAEVIWFSREDEYETVTDSFDDALVDLCSDVVGKIDSEYMEGEIANCVGSNEMDIYEESVKVFRPTLLKHARTSLANSGKSVNHTDTQKKFNF